MAASVESFRCLPAGSLQRRGARPAACSGESRPRKHRQGWTQRPVFAALPSPLSSRLLFRLKLKKKTKKKKPDAREVRVATRTGETKLRAVPHSLLLFRFSEKRKREMCADIVEKKRHLTIQSVKVSDKCDFLNFCGFFFCFCSYQTLFFCRHLTNYWRPPESLWKT